MTLAKFEKMALSPCECAELCGLHVNTVRKLVQDKKLPAIKLGRKILISRIELEKWLAGQSTQPPVVS